jgi:hypothetical protein
MLMLSSLRTDDIRELSRMGPHEAMAGAINQSAGSGGYSAYESIEVVSRNSVIMGSSDNQCGCGYLFKPRPAVERHDSPDRATHRWGAIGG